MTCKGNTLSEDRQGIHACKPLLVFVQLLGAMQGIVAECCTW